MPGAAAAAAAAARPDRGAGRARRRDAPALRDPMDDAVREQARHREPRRLRPGDVTVGVEGSRSRTGRASGRRSRWRASSRCRSRGRDRPRVGSRHGRRRRGARAIAQWGARPTAGRERALHARGHARAGRPARSPIDAQGAAAAVDAPLDLPDRLDVGPGRALLAPIADWRWCRGVRAFDVGGSTPTWTSPGPSTSSPASRRARAGPLLGRTALARPRAALGRAARGPGRRGWSISRTCPTRISGAILESVGAGAAAPLLRRAASGCWRCGTPHPAAGGCARASRGLRHPLGAPARFRARGGVGVPERAGDYRAPRGSRLDRAAGDSP